MDRGVSVLRPTALAGVKVSPSCRLGVAVRGFGLFGLGAFGVA